MHAANAAFGRGLRHLARILGRSPGFTVTVVLTLAVGCAANTAVFSVVDNVLLEPLPYPESDRLVAVWHTAPGAPGLVEVSGGLRPSPSMYFTYAEQNRTFEHIGIWVPANINVTGLTEPEEVRGVVVTNGTLQALDVPPLLGRWLSAEDQQAGGPLNVMIGYGYWQRRFGGDPAVLGQRITADGGRAEIVGVMPRGFRFADNDADLIVPARIDRATLTLPPFCCEAVARLKPGVTIDEANDDMARMLPIWVDSWPKPVGAEPREVYLDTWQITPALRPLKQDVVGDVGSVLWIVMGTVGVVLLIACINVASLVLLRTQRREHELAVRSALGAGAWRIGRGLLLEGVLLGLLGGALGLALAYGALEALVAFGPSDLPRLAEISIDWRVLAFTLGVALLAGSVLGLSTVLKHARARVAAALHTGGRGASRDPARYRAQHVLVVAQVALALVLLVGSGLMIRTFWALHSVDPGFAAPRELQTVRIGIPESLAAEPERVARTQQAILTGLAAVPGVDSAAFAGAVPLEGSYGDWDGIEVEGRALAAQAADDALRRFRYVSPGYIDTLGTQLVAGREITWTDVFDLRPVVMISENLAREYWDRPRDALGRRLRVAENPSWREIVGVVQDIHDNGLDEAAPSIVYWPSMSQSPYLPDQTYVRRNVTFILRSTLTGTPGFLRQIQSAVWAVEPSLPVASVRTMQEVYDASLARTSFTLVVLGAGGALALVLGIVGLYGVISYTISQRRREIAIRLALGEPQRALRRRYVRYGLSLALTGVALGAGAAAGLSRLMTALLFEVAPLDAPTYLAVAAVLTAVAALASYLPARRASAVAPAEALVAE